MAVRRGVAGVGVGRACRRRLSHEGGEEASCDAESKIDMGWEVFVERCGCGMHMGWGDNGWGGGFPWMLR